MWTKNVKVHYIMSLKRCSVLILQGKKNMSGSTRKHALSLYKSLLRESKKFNSYNFRMYALEKTRNEYRANRGVTDPEQIAALLKKAKENLDIVKRQVLIGQMYGEGHLIIEKPESQKKT